jgi:hypothetical protein
VGRPELADHLAEQIVEVAAGREAGQQVLNESE